MSDPVKAADEADTVLFLSNDATYLHRFRGPLMASLKARGYRIVACAPAEAVASAAIQAMGVTFHPWRLDPRGGRIGAEITAVLDLIGIVRAYRPQVFFGYTVKPVIYGALVCRALGVRRRTGMIAGLGRSFGEGGGWKQSITRRLAAFAYRLATRSLHLTVFQNPDDRDALRRLGGLGAEAPVALVDGSGVDLQQFKPVDPPKAAPVFVMIARLLRDKGVGEFVAAARLVRETLPQARFLLAGGPDSTRGSVTSEQLEAWRAEGVVELLGHVTDPARLLAQANVFVLPSYYMEGCPRVNLEAMASGRPIITTDWVGCRETVIPEETGLLVPPRDVEALAAAMIRLGSDLPLAARMGKAGRNYAERRFDVIKVAARTVSLIAGDATPEPPATRPTPSIGSTSAIGRI